ncbi:hypothetical protein L1887_20707 [Cichorium endivia]|nr:hypothetical protein L1887_20707 [Cichorium endivia]
MYQMRKIVWAVHVSIRYISYSQNIYGLSSFGETFWLRGLFCIPNSLSSHALFCTFSSTSALHLTYAPHSTARIKISLHQRILVSPATKKRNIFLPPQQMKKTTSFPHKYTNSPHELLMVTDYVRSTGAGGSI